MAQTKVIPSNMKPFWECEINGKKYSYPAGSTQSVPDEVASLIDIYNASLPQQDNIPERLLPVVDADLDGKVLGVEDGVFKVIDTPLPIMDNIPDATEDDVVDVVNSLITALIDAGYMEEPASPPPIL